MDVLSLSRVVVLAGNQLQGWGLLRGLDESFSTVLLVSLLLLLGYFFVLTQPQLLECAIPTTFSLKFTSDEMKQ